MDLSALPGLFSDVSRRDAPRTPAPTTKNAEGPGTDAKSSWGTLQSFSLEAAHLDFSAESQQRALTGTQDNLSLEATFRDGNTITTLSLDISRTVLTFGGAIAPDDFRNKLLEAVPEDVRQEIEKYLGESSEGGLPDFLSPDAVATRIFDFARLGYEGFLADDIDSEDTRNNFLDIIRPAIDRGFDEALHILEAFLDEPTTELVETTRGLVHGKLGEFKGVNLAA